MGNDKQQPPAPAYRGAMVQNRALQNNLINTGAQKAGKSAASAQSIKFGGQTNNVMTLETDAAAPNSKGAQKVEIQVIGGDVAAPMASAVKINEVSHTTVANSSPQKVISQLTETIASYSDAVHTELDEANLSISGTAFVGDYHAVHFKIDVTSDADGNTHFEFLRISGSALAAAKFLGIVNRVFADAEKIHQKSDSGNLMVDSVVDAVNAAMSEAAAAEESSLVALNMDLPDIKMDDAAQEKMSVMDALHSDDLGGVEMDGASEAYLTQKLVEGGAMKATAMDAKDRRAKLVEALLEADVLGHGDVAVVRAATLILVNLMDAFAKEIVSAETLEVISGAVANANAKVNVLARRYLVRLLSAMASATGNSKGDWAMAKGNNEGLVRAVKAVQSELAAKKEVELKQREFADVDCAAVLKKLSEGNDTD